MKVDIEVNTYIHVCVSVFVYAYVCACVSLCMYVPTVYYFCALCILVYFHNYIPNKPQVWVKPSRYRHTYMCNAFDNFQVNSHIHNYLSVHTKYIPDNYLEKVMFFSSI